MQRWLFNFIALATSVLLMDQRITAEESKTNVSQKPSEESIPQVRASLYGSSEGLKCPIAVVPGKSFGPLALGMSADDMKNLGLKIKIVSGTRFYLVGMFAVGLDESNKVQFIEAEIGDLPHCVKFEEATLSPKSTPEKLAKRFESCSSQKMLYGGNIIECKGLQIGSGAWGGQQKTPSLKIVRFKPVP